MIKCGVTKLETYLELINSPRPFGGGKETNFFAHITKLEHQRHQLDRHLNTYQVPLTTHQAWVLEGWVGYQKYFEIW